MSLLPLIHRPAELLAYMQMRARLGIETPGEAQARQRLQQALEETEKKP